ncbi:MAG TPA: hypothetical protein VK402_00510 [Blastococcus sp.]|nr:hypothetical protein [Blastococcus sp.]
MNPPRRLPAGLSRIRLTRLAGVFVVLLAMTAVPAADAAFSDSASLPTTTISTNTLAPPTNIAVSQSCTPPPPVVFRGASSNRAQDQLTIATPVGTQAGDVLVAQVANRSGLFSGLTAPSGWTLLGRTNSGGQVTEAVFYKVAGSVEPASHTFGLVGSSGVQMAGGIAAYDGVWTVDPVEAFGVRTGASATASTPSVTTTVANTVLLHTITKRQEDLPAPAGTTPRWQVYSGTGTATEGATASDESFAGPGATPTRSSSTGFNSEWVTHTIALRPVPGTPYANGTWTATPSAWATGYRVERLVGGVVQLTGYLTPVSATSATDGPLSNGVTYTYRIVGYYQSWTSTPQTATLTTNC